MPIVWNEPVSFLQRFSENVLYSYLLDRADECDDPLMRMQVRRSLSNPTILDSTDFRGRISPVGCTVSFSSLV